MKHGWWLLCVSLVACTDSDPQQRAAGPAHPGQMTYERFCIACHKLGISGAPKIGSAEDWRPRAEKGTETLLARSIEGIAPAMPPKGGCLQCSNEELAAAIDYMLERSLGAESSR
jgi:cytochrome c5